MDKREKIRAILTDFSGSVPMSDFRRARIGKTTDEIMALIEAQPAGELVEAAQHRPRLNRDVSTRLREYAEAMEATAESEEDIEDAAGLLALLDWQEALGDQS